MPHLKRTTHTRSRMSAAAPTRAPKFSHAPTHARRLPQYGHHNRPPPQGTKTFFHTHPRTQRLPPQDTKILTRENARTKVAHTRAPNFFARTYARTKAAPTRAPQIVAQSSDGAQGGDRTLRQPLQGKASHQALGLHNVTVVQADAAAMCSFVKAVGSATLS